MVPLFMLLACAADGGGDVVIELDAELSEIVPTVATVSGTVQGADAAWILAGREEQEELRVSLGLDADGAFTMPLLGLKPGSDYRLWVEARGGATSTPVDLQTGSRPTDLAPFEVEQLDPERTSGGYLVTGAVVPATPLIVDRDGDMLWWYRPDDVVTLGRARLSRDGSRMLMLPLNLDGDEQTELISVALDGSDEQRLTVPYAHHDFIEKADGTLAFIAYEPREIDGELQEGDSIVELSPDGELRTIYSIWDHHDFNQPAPGDTAWPHGNALHYIEEDDDYLVSLLFLGGIARVDGATGEEEWFLGGEDSSFSTPDGEGISFDFQHGMDLEEDRLLVFDNGHSAELSSVVELQLDEAAGVATETWRYWSEAELYNPTMGDVVRLPADGGGDQKLLVTYSFNGVVQEIDTDGTLLWQLSAYLSGSLSYLVWQERLQP